AEVAAIDAPGYRVLLLTFANSAAHAETIAGRATVIDGDTLEIHSERIRILDIDAPESRQTCRALSGSEWKCGQWVARAVRVDWSARREPPKAPRAVERR